MSGVETFLAGNGRGSRAFYQFARFVVVSVCRLYLRMSVEGRENVPTSGAFVLAPVHRSYIDTPIASGCTRRRLRFMGKDSLWKKEPYRWTLSALGGFPVSRGTADREAILRSVQVLESGEPLVLFPEGERKSGPIVQPLFAGPWRATRQGTSPRRGASSTVPSACASYPRCGTHRPPRVLAPLPRVWSGPR